MNQQTNEEPAVEEGVIFSTFRESLILWWFLRLPKRLIELAFSSLRSHGALLLESTGLVS